jgi:hypothetical protein
MSQEYSGVAGANGQGGMCATRSWRAVDRAGFVVQRNEAIRRLSELGWSRHAIAARLGVAASVVARAQMQAGGAP